MRPISVHCLANGADRGETVGLVVEIRRLEIIETALSRCVVQASRGPSAAASATPRVSYSTPGTPATCPRLHLACAACVRDAACAIARHVASAFCARALLCSAACALRAGKNGGRGHPHHHHHPHVRRTYVHAELAESSSDSRDVARLVRAAPPCAIEPISRQLTCFSADAPATNPAAAAELPPSRGLTTRPLRASPRVLDSPSDVVAPTPAPHVPRPIPPANKGHSLLYTRTVLVVYEGLSTVHRGNSGTPVPMQISNP